MNLLSTPVMRSVARLSSPRAPVTVGVDSAVRSLWMLAHSPPATLSHSSSSSSSSHFIKNNTQHVQSPSNNSNNTTLSHHYFSSDSHDDFAPKRKAVVSDVDQAIKMIADHVRDNPIMLYMKGNPSQPMCGFSATVVKILQAEGIDFSSVNVLDYPAIREGVKKYSEWPTIPQLYVNGEFIGGCDIITSMHESGELAELIREVKEEKGE